MQNPFYTRNAASESLEDMRSLCVDRTQELKLCAEALVERRHNILLYGPRGVGKTFLLRLVEQELRESDEVFPCTVNLASLGAYGGPDDATGFPRAVLLQFCTSIWKGLMGKSYLDLRDRLNETGQEITFRNKAESSVQRVYTQLMLLERMHKASVLNSAGFAAGLKGEKKEEIGDSAREAQVLPFEFAEFAHVLISTALVPNGKRRVVFFCDEANHMPVFRQEEILDRYLELFSAKQVQFVFVAGFLPWEKSYVPSCFETRLELCGFSDRSFVAELIDTALAKSNVAGLRFTDEAVDALYEAYKGNPRETIEACASAYHYAGESDKLDVTASLVMRACREMDERRQKEEAMMREFYASR